MKIKNGFVLRDICGENVIVSEGLENIDFSEIITLNESAAEIWKALLDRDFTVQDAVQVLLDMYEVDEPTAQADAEALVQSWRETGLIQD